MATVAAIVGAQYGSEGKGVVAKHLAHDYDVWVRTGGPNAGHSFVHEGRLWKMQSLPCGWVNKEAVLYLGPGAVINPGVLVEEIRKIEEVYGEKFITSRLYVHPNATPILPKHVDTEGHTKGEIHQRIGSTGEGVGEARRARIERNLSNESSGFINSYLPEDIFVDEYEYQKRDKIMVEGTQGSGLSLVHGEWPYTTSADTNVGQFLVDAGLPPRVDRVILVARTHPIRVAGNSGPLLGETTWEEMSDKLERDVEERTTVTKKVRRIGIWDEKLFLNACKLNAPTDIALTFIDYLNPEDHNCTREADLSKKAKDFINHVERISETPVNYVGTGFNEEEGWCCIER